MSYYNTYGSNMNEKLKQLRSDLDTEINLGDTIEKTTNQTTFDYINSFLPVENKKKSYAEYSSDIQMARETLKENLLKIFKTGNPQRDATNVLSRLTDNDVLLIIQSWQIVEEHLKKFDLVSPELFLFAVRKILSLNILFQNPAEPVEDVDGEYGGIGLNNMPRPPEMSEDEKAIIELVKASRNSKKMLNKIHENVDFNGEQSKIFYKEVNNEILKCVGNNYENKKLLTSAIILIESGEYSTEDVVREIPEISLVDCELLNIYVHLNTLMGLYKIGPYISKETTEPEGIEKEEAHGEEIKQQTPENEERKTFSDIIKWTTNSDIMKEIRKIYKRGDFTANYSDMFYNSLKNFLETLLREKYTDGEIFNEIVTYNEAGIEYKDIEPNGKNKYLTKVDYELFGVYCNCSDKLEEEFTTPLQTPKKGKEEPRKEEGKGLKKKKKLIHGRGLEPQKQKKQTYVKFGSKILNLKSLEENVLNLKYEKRRATIHNFSRCMVSDALKDVIIDTIENEKINEVLVKQLTNDDRALFIKLLVICDLSYLYKYDDAQYKSDLERYKILESELSVNDNPQIKIEMIQLLKKLYNVGKINYKKFNQLLQELI